MSYSTIIQKDLPLATWELEETPTAGGAVACDRFLGSTYNGLYAATTAQGLKGVPLIFGSNKSALITSNTGGYAMQIPSLDRLSIKTKNQPFSIEFWIKFYSPSFAAPAAITKIMGKPGSETGIYIHNSSIIAVVGDVVGATAKVAVQVPNIKKPMHIVMTYFNNTVSLSVNGQISSKSVPFNVITNTYNSANEYFRFLYPGTNLEYALDQISLYSRVLDIATIRRHMIYGFGYEMPNQVAKNYGGYRYNLSMVQTPYAGKYEKGDATSWSNPTSISNMIVENGYLRIAPIYQPLLKYATDKTSSVFAWDTTEGLKVAAGGYVELRDLQGIAQSANYGYGLYFYRATSITKLGSGVEETLLYFDNKTDPERYVRFYLIGTSTGESLNVQVDNNTPVTLMTFTTGAFTSGISCGLYYSATNQQLTTFAGYNTSTGITTPITISSTTTDTTFNPYSMRIGSSPAYSDSEKYSVVVTSSQDKRFTGGIQRIVHLSALPTLTTLQNVQNSIFNAINNYSAQVDLTTNPKRFIMKAKGTYNFSIDLKRLAGSNLSFVGNHRIEWGSNSPEVVVTAVGKGYNTEDAWLSSTTLANNSALGTLVDESPGTSKYLNITITVTANDIEDNPTKIYYFRIISYPTTFASSLYTTTIVSDGPDMNINSTAANPNILPTNTETPFLFDEEQGGLYVSKSAVIPYSSAPISSGGTAGLRGISFFINPSSSTTNIISATDGTNTASITSSSGTLTVTGGVAYINGSTTGATTITSGVWSHVVFLFNNRQIVSNTTNCSITFGAPSTGTANFYLDEIMTLDADTALGTSDVTNINSLYKGGGVSIVGDYATNNIAMFDNESYANNTIYQPLNNSVTHITSVDYVTSTAPTGTYNGAISQLIADGKVMVAGDRVLVPSSGIYQISNPISSGSSIGFLIGNPGNSTVYVKSGNINAGKFYRRTNGDWYETVGLRKIKSYGFGKDKLVARVDIGSTSAQ